MSYHLRLRQQVTLMINRWDLTREAPAPAALGYIEQQRMTLRERVTCWQDRERGAVLFTLAAENVLELRGRYVVADAAGAPLARLEKRFRSSLARSTYAVTLPDGRTLLMHERSAVQAVARRLWSAVVSWPWFLPIQFDLLDGDLAIGRVERQWSRLRDVYDVTVDDDRIDERVAAACAVAVDAFMNR